jgi:hypothetical protein
VICNKNIKVVLFFFDCIYLEDIPRKNTTQKNIADELGVFEIKYNEAEQKTPISVDMFKAESLKCEDSKNSSKN